MQTGELTAVLDGLVTEQENLPSCTSSPATETKQEDGQPSARADTRLVSSEPTSDTVNGKSASSAPTDSASAVDIPGASEETILTLNCTSAATEDPPIGEIPASSEQ